MKIGILASPTKQAAWESKQTPAVSYSWVQDSKAHEDYDVFIDLDFDNHTERMISYSTNIRTVFILGAVKSNIESAFHQHKLSWTGALNNKNQIIGFNSMCTFIERNTFEFTNPLGIDQNTVQNIAVKLGYPQIEVVESRVGLITPRVVCMIINEAYYTVQEGTANRDDIDQAMKLGTNYPMGPFEWCKKIGITDVYETLEALYNDTHDERYKICSLLKHDYLTCS
jgi:3-hydroxybutyryl-CoA dehydrogenase